MTLSAAARIASLVCFCLACGSGAASGSTASGTAAPTVAATPTPEPTPAPRYRPVVYDDMDQEGSGDFDTNLLLAVLDAQRAAIASCADTYRLAQPAFRGTVVTAAVNVGTESSTLAVSPARAAEHDLALCISAALEPGVGALRCEGGNVVFAIPLVFE
jgi:hypothetical protein